MADNHSTQATKRCTRCGEEKPIDQFVRDGNRVRNQCRICRAADLRANRARETPEQRAHRLAYYKKYNEEHSDEIKRWKAGWYAEARGEALQHSRERYLNDPAFRRAAIERAKRWRVAFKDRKLEANKRWALANPEKARLSSILSKRRRRQDAVNRLHDSVSTQMRNALVNGKNGLRWERLVGYSVDELAQHLERQFLKRMSWANYGKWHIDHIVPIASFKITGPNDPALRECWALTNLRPLWARDNIIKSDRRTYLL